MPFSTYDLNFSQELIAVGRPNRPGTVINPTFITVHNTDNPKAGADADAHSSFVRKTGYYVDKGVTKYVSWHLTVDDTEVIKHLPYNETAWHAGKGNTRSVAIEQCMQKGIDTVAADERLCQLLALLCVELKISTSKIVPHKYWTGKNCPSVLLAKWDEIIARVENLLGERAISTVDNFMSFGERNLQPLERLHPSWLEELESPDIDEDEMRQLIGRAE